MNQLMMCAVAFAVVFGAKQANAEVLRLQPEFSFKRVTVPSRNSTSRITVQIDPTAPRIEPVMADPVVEKPSETIPIPRSTGLEWFWLAVSPSLKDSGPGRLAIALKEMEEAPAGMSVPSPRLQSLQTIATRHGLDILRATVGTDVSPALVLAVIAVESGGRTQAESHAGAQGLMQLMPATADRFGVTNVLDPAQNIKGGVAYLAWLLKHFNNDPILTLAGYNAGEGNVREHSGVPPFTETRSYVPKVLAAWRVAKGLCQTPPELVTDGCVFNVNGI